MSKILIVGSYGMLGTALTERFRASHEVVGLDRPEIDITDSVATREKIFALKPDVIINTAAINAVDDIESKPEVYELAVRVNGKALTTLGEVGDELNIPVVHFSSDYVFDGTNKEGYREDDKPSPINKYGETKLAGEAALQGATKNFYIIRLSRLFGPAGTGEGTKASFVDKMLQAHAAGKELKVVDAEWSCPTYSIDLAEFVFNVLEQKLPYGIYHATNADACTWYEWAREIFRLKDIPVEIVKISETDLVRPAKRPMYSELLNTKTTPLRSWEEALASYLSL